MNVSSGLIVQTTETQEEHEGLVRQYESTECDGE